MRIFGAGQLLWALAFSDIVLAFPDAGSSHDGLAHKGLHKRCPFANEQAQKNSDHEKRFLFSSMDSPVDSKLTSIHAHGLAANTGNTVTGEHEFQPPNFENGDQRGPCPGLNALANHGYIPRHGVVSVSQSSSIAVMSS